MSETDCKKTPMWELCRDALAHYEKIASQSGEWNSLIPKAIEFYKKMHTPYDESIDRYYQEEKKDE